MACDDIPSLLDLQKVKKHADDFGRLMGTGTGTSTNEVTGQVRPTFNKVIEGIGIPVIGNFTTGCTVTQSNQGVQVQGSSVYRWSGILPKVVPPLSSPATTGGISPSGDWVDVGDASVYTRVFTELQDTGGTDLIGYKGGMSLSDLIATEPAIITPFINDAATHQLGFQAAINAGSIRVPAGSNINIIGDITIPANRLIIVDQGATVTSNGRFTAYGVNNVHWIINGSVLSVDMTAAPAKPGWPNTGEGTQLGDERGFIEFGGVILGGNDGKDYSVYIGPTGVVAGDWVGTPNFSDQVRQVNRKGIAAWNCSNVSFVSDGEIYGFEGEAVYWACGSAAAKNIYMRAQNLHDCRFNGLNVNASNSYENIKIDNSTTRNCYQGIESSAGDVTNCKDYGSVAYAIYAGQGAGGSKRLISGNQSFNCLGTPFAILYNIASGLISDVTVTNNHASNPASNFLAISAIGNIQAHGNTCNGMKAGRFLQVTSCSGGSITGNYNFNPAAGTEHYYEAECYSLFKADNRRIPLGGSYNLLMKADDAFTGGYNSLVSTHGNRENSHELRATFPAAGSGPEYRFSYDQTLPFVAATISSNLVAYDAGGAKGDICFNNLKINTSDTLGTSWFIRSTGHFEPSLDGFSNVGSPSKRCNVVYSVGGVQTTSDANKKTDVAALTEKEKSLASELKGLIRTYRLIGSDKKSFGVVAQSVCAAFERNGLDWREYDVVHLDNCDDGTSIYSVKYDQLLALILSAM